jgi:SfnB family sulfur acquisition oxidoreductase
MTLAPSPDFAPADLAHAARAATAPDHAAAAPRAATVPDHAAAAPRAAAAIIGSDREALDVAHLLAAEFAREAAQRDRERRLPHAELARFSASGLWGITVPREHGGAGVSALTLARVIEIISAADGSLGQIPQNHFYALEVLRVHGSATQQRFFYARALAGERFGNALAERSTRTASERSTRLVALPQAGVEPGTEPGTASSTAAPTAYRLSGEKFYATGAYYADWIPTAVGDAQGNQLLAFVARHARGVAVIDDWSGFGQRTTASGTVRFDAVEVPAEHVVPLYIAQGPRTTVRPFAQILHAAIDLGIARGAYAQTRAFVREHARAWIESNQDRAGDDPLTINEFGRLAVRLEAADALVERAAHILDQARAEAPGTAAVAAQARAALAELAAVAVAEARTLTTEVALSAATKLLELSGTRASASELGFDRYWRNARVHTVHDPVRWKVAAVGQFYLHDRLPSVSGTT